LSKLNTTKSKCWCIWRNAKSEKANCKRASRES